MKRTLLFIIIAITLGTLGALGACRDLGTEPQIISPAWVKVENFQHVRSNWLDMISVRAWVQDKPDSMMIVIGADGGSRFTSGDVLRGDGEAVCRFFFPNGYVGRLPAELQLSVYVKCQTKP